ncbi:hypothetical protein BYT27DRAFT_7141497 [Phlegmacium glaucopus]|nr:hypothetical protein BYT27DRAFT_7141497 [Phlegmacium glaucopus]
MGGVISYPGVPKFGDTPDAYNTTNSIIEKYHEVARQARADRDKARADAADAKKLAKEAAQLESQAKRLKQEALNSQSEAKKREADYQIREQNAKLELEKREKEAKEREGEAERFPQEFQQALSLVEKCEVEAQAWILEAQEEAEARMAADDARKREEICLDLVTFRPQGLTSGGIQPEVWPTEEEFQFAKNGIQYDPEKIHFAVCGSPGSGKSSFVNAVRGLNNNNPHAAPTGVTETTKTVTRYPDPRKETTYKRLVWFDCPGAGTLKVPGWQYFNQQGLFIFDVIVLVYDVRLTAIDMCIIQNCERFDIPLFIVRSKSDTHIRNILHDLGHGDAREDNCEKYQEQARKLLIDKTKCDLEANIEEAGLAMHDIFIISSHVLYSLVTKKWIKKTPLVIDEARLVESVFKAAYARRYGARVPTKISSAIIVREENIITPPPSLYSTIE